MRVLLVNKFNFLKGGSDRYFLELADLLSVQPGIKVAKFCMTHPQNLPDKNSKYFVSDLNFDHFHWGNAFKYLSHIFYSFEAKKKFGRLLDDFKPDVIHIHNIYHHLSPSILVAAKKRNIPVVMHIHDYKLVCPNYKMFTRGVVDESCRGGKYYRCALKKCFKNSWLKSFLVTAEMYLHHKILKIYERNIDLYISPSKFVKNKLVEWGMPANKIKVLYHFVNSKDIEPNYELGKYLLYFGRLDKEKGIDVLINAMSHIHGGMKLKIVGPGPERKNLQSLVGELGLMDKIEFVGPKYGAVLNKIIAGAYLIIVPSVWYEVFGLVILEAAAQGKFVIASDIGGIKEAVESSRSALLFQPGNVYELATKIDWSINNPKAVTDFAHEARNFVTNKFSTSDHLKNLLAIYHEVIK